MHLTASGTWFEPATYADLESHSPWISVETEPLADGVAEASEPVSALLGFDIHALSPDALMIYLDTRLRSLDSRIDAIFVRQQDNERIRKALLAMQELLSLLDENADDPKHIL